MTGSGALALSGRGAAAALLVALAALLALPLQGHAQTSVPHDWSLKPSGLDTRDKFRLLFASSTKRNANPSDIAIYNTFVQTRAAAGHTDIQAYSAGFKVVGCTGTVDATDNTGTTGTGVPIYWLDGDKVADDYADFYDGSWDSRSPTTETGASVTTTSTDGVITGCSAIGTDGGATLGDGISVSMGNPSGNGSGLSGALTRIEFTHRLYGLSVVFQVSASTDAKLSALVVNDGTNDRTLTPTFVPGTFDYDADVGNAVTTVTLTATVNNANATVTGVTLDGTAIADTDFSDGITVPSLAEDDNEIVVTVTAENNVNNTKDYTVTVSRARRGTTTPTPPGEVEVPNNWILIPTGLVTGDKFRLLFLSSTSTDGSSYDIADYNTFVQGRAAAGHTDIQAYSSAFRVVGCTSDSNATANTGAYNIAGTGVSIHWLNGNKVADDYEDFYDGSWDDEANDKNELGANGPDTSQTANFPLTGCQDYGEEANLGGRSLGLGQPTPRVGRPNSSATGSGPIHSLSFVGPSDSRPMYGLSQVFEVGAPTDVTLRDLELEGAPGGETILLSPDFDSATETYTAAVVNRVDAVTLTARKKDTTATVAITNDDDTSTEGEAELDLNVGSNTLTVTVTAADTTAKTYTITVTRAAVLPAPTDCPADTDWCTTLGVGYATSSGVSSMFEEFGYLANSNFGDLLSTTFSHGGTSYTVSQVYRSKNTSPDGNTVLSDKLSIAVSSALPDGTVLQLGSRTFTVDTDSETTILNQEEWDLRGNSVSWTAGQHVTASLKFPTAPNLPTGLTATASGGTQIDLAWVAPADNGGATISGYKIEVSADGGTNWTDLLANTGTTSVTYSHTGLTRGSTRHYRVSAINTVGTGAASDPASATTATSTPPAPVEITVPNDWSLIPTGLSTGDKFRLIFLSSTKTNATSTDIVDYNSFIQGRAAAGHTDIQTYSAGFRAVGCTADSDARDNTATTGTGVVIHWLNGNKVADDYADFYNGSWDDEANDKDEDGTDGPNTTISGNFPWTGCEHNGTEATFSGDSRALGAGTVRIGRPNSSVTNNGPLSSANNHSSSGRRLMYGLSQIFEVAAAANTAATGTPSIVGTPQVGMVLTAAKGTLADADGTTKADNGDTGYAYSYQWVRVDGSTETPITSATASTYTLTATDLGKTIKVQTSFTDDGDTAEGPLTSAATVAVLAVAVACPTDNDWCTTLTVEFRQQSPSVHYYGYIETFDTGALDDTTINYGGMTWRIYALYINDDAGTRTMIIDFPLADGFLPRGSVFTLGGQEFTATAAAEDATQGIYNWPVPAGMAWIDGQEVTVSVTLANFAATGKPAISGTATVGETLMAAIGNIADTDGLPTTFPDDYTFEWLRVDGGTDSTITGATASTYTPVAADVGKKVKVKVDFTDDAGTGEDRTSNAYPSSGTIVSDTLPVLSFVPTLVNVDEDAGSATLTVELAPASTGTVTVDYATRDLVGGAIAGDDYTATSGTLTFAATETSKTITVPILNDDVYENALEAFSVDLSNPTGATLPDPPSATVRIDSEEAVPTASMADVTVDEGAGTMTLILRLSHLSSADIAYVTSVGNVTGTATEGDDYDDFLLGPGRTAKITVPGGSLSHTFDITLVDDGVDEADETIVIVWRKSIGDEVTPSTFTFTGTIVPAPLPALSFALSIVTVDEDAGTVTLTVELDPASTGTVTVDFATRDHFAKEGEDYTATSGTLTFTAGQTSKTITVPITDDDVYEAPGLTGEIFFINISNPAGATLPDPPTAKVIIDSEEAVPTASMADVTVDEGAGTMTLTLRLNHPSQEDIAYSTIDGDVTGTATAGEDYDDFLLLLGGIARITVPAFNLSQTFDITVVDDGVDEPDETIVIVWQKSTSDKVTPEFFTFTGTIVPEPLPALSFVPTVVDVDEDAGSATLTVELDPASTGTVTVDFATRDSAAKAGEDYTTTSGTLTFTAGQTSKTFTVPITDDDVYENGLEAFFVDLSNPTGATLPDPPTAAVSIDSEDAVPTASLADVTVDEGAGTMTLTLRLSHPSDAEIAYFTIYDEDIATGTATEGEDYDDFLLGPPGRTARITVPAGDLSQTFDITLVDDGVDEPDETIVIEWIRNSNDDATPDFIIFTGTITDNDTADNNPTVRFGATSYTAIEGVAGAVVTVELFPAAARAVTILVTATPQDGASSADYDGVPQSVTFAAGETEQSFTVTATDDTVDDDGESVQLGFDALPSGVLLGSPATATVALVAGSGVSTWFLFFEESSYTATEGGTAARVTVGLSNPWKPALNESLTIGIFTPEHRGGADASDYSGVPARVTFQPGQTRVSFTVTATDDSDDDDGESIYLQFAGFDIEDLELDRAPRATTVHLRDNDGAIAVQAFFGAQTYRVNEGSTVDVSVRLDKAPGRALTILITTAHGNGASSADYTGVPESITFSGSQSMRTFAVQAQNDNVNDDQEYLTFGFGALPASVAAGDPATTTLNLVDTNDNISIRTISFDAQDTNVRELLEGSIYSLYVYLNSAADNDIVVPLQVTHLDGATTADYSGLPETVIIPAGERRENVIIRVLEDAEDDHGEGIRVRFGPLPRGVRKDNRADTATFRFLDNDTLPAISIAGADVKEWPNPQSYLNFVAALDYAPEFEVAVDYRTVNGSAVAGQDYESRSGTLTFAEGERSKYIRVLVCHDGIDESTETMTLQLSNPVRTKLEGNGSATGSIRNNNGSGAKPCATGISVSDVSAPEPNSNHLQRQEIEFEVSLNQADTGTVSADYRTVNGTATAGQDYEPASGTVTFRPGQTRRTVKVVVIADAHDDPGETFTLRLSNPSGAYIGDGEGTATLTNSGLMPGAWLSRFGRVASDHAVQAIEARIYDTSGHARENHLTIGGQRVDWQMLGRFAPSRDGRPGPGQRGDRASPDGVAPRLDPWLDPWLGDQGARTRMDRLGAKAMAGGSLASGNPAIDSLSGEGMAGVDSGRGRGSGGGDAKGTFRRAVMDLLGLEDFARLSEAGIGLMGSSFFYSRPGGDETPGWLGPWSLWGETAVTRFDGAEGPLSLNGDVTTATVGFDTRRERWMAGLVLAYSEGQGAYTHRSATGGAMDSSLTSLIPYASYSLNERTSVWGTLGYGVGDLTLTPEGAASGIETDLSTAVAAVGGRGVFSVRTAGAAQFEFAVRADARFTSTVSDAVENLAGAVGATSRVRAVLEGRGSVPLAWGGDLSPRLEVGLRYDGGDAETGAGLELGGGLGYAAGNLLVEVSARGLVAHEDSAYEEWGFSSSISYAPSEDGRGLSMRLGSAWGATQSGVQSLWNQQDASGLARSTAFEAAQRYQAELGYGIAGRRWNSLWAPFIAVQAADGGGQALRTGLKLTSGSDFEVGLELGRRQGRPGADPEHAVQLRASILW